MIDSKKLSPQGVEIRIAGTVQGVGFRPFVYALARRFQLRGTVANTPAGVVVRAWGDSRQLESFQQALRSQAPPLARIHSLEQQPLPESAASDSFQIIASESGSTSSAAIPADIAICADCLRELHDPSDRRFRYPFINCINCGPRLTIVETTPYDRPLTSMRDFPMCPECLTEYQDPGNRRFHAQASACPRCGPQLTLCDQKGNVLVTDKPLALTAEALAAGQIVALRSLGGYHLCVDAANEQAVAELRRRKSRPDKPLALMLPDIAAVRALCQLLESEEKTLRSPEHPIVLLPLAGKSPLATGIAPGTSELGIMLPYTPLHHLLFAEPGCPQTLVMTSGNLSGEPIATSNADALTRLGGIADLFLTHNREIVTRLDDSLCRIVEGKTMLLRRSRGYVPEPLTVPWQLPALMACGAGLKNTVTLARGPNLYTSQHIGDLSDTHSYQFFQETILHLRHLYQVDPEMAVCDLHPDYLSSHFARQTGLPLYPVQHHHAHAVAVMAEHGLTQPTVALVLDGTGLGDDGTLWGGELLLAEATSYQRLGHFSPLPLPGGDAASQQPWRMALAALYQLRGSEGLFTRNLPAGLVSMPAGHRQVIGQMLAHGLNCPRSSSCGRLFDAIAALLGIRQEISYEGQAAIELEALAHRAAPDNWPLHLNGLDHLEHPAVTWEEGKIEINSLFFVTLALSSLARGETAAVTGLIFHQELIHACSQAVQLAVARTGVNQVVLAGGCLQNLLLLTGLSQLLRASGLEVFYGQLFPVNDGGISVGQAVIGGLRHVSCHSDASS